MSRRLVLLVLLVLLPSLAHAAGAVMLTGCGGNDCINNVSTSATNFFQARGVATPVTSESATIETVVPFAGTGTTIQCLSFSTGGSAASPGAGKSYAITFRKDEADTALTCTIADTNTSCTLTGQSVSISAGDRVCYKSVPAGTPSGRVLKCSVEVDPT